MPHQGMSVAHGIYIPLCIAFGLVLGWIFGVRGAKSRIVRLEEDVERLEREASAARLGQRDEG